MYNNKTRKDSEGIVLRHPALTRFFAAFLAVVSVLTLISGGICIRKAADSREKQNTNTARLSEKTAEAKELCAKIAAAPVEFERQSAAYDEAKARYDSEKTSYRKDLSIYTATEAALKQGQEKLDEGYAALRTGWIQHDNGEKALDEAEAQFRPGYEQYLAGKKQLEEGRKQYAQAEKLKESLPDLALVRAGLEAVKGSESELSASLGAIRDTIQNPPRDAETDEIDTEALRAQLLAQFTALSGQMETVRGRISGAYSADELEKALAPAAAAMNNFAAQLADGSTSAEELIASAGAMISQGQSAGGSLESVIANAEQTLTMLEKLPELKEQLDQAEAALKEGEPMLLEAKKGFEEGRKELDKAKQMLIYAEAQLIAGKKELEEKQAEQLTTKEDLDRRKTEMEEEAVRLDAMLLEVEEYREKKDRFGNLRYALLADEGIAARVRAGEDLIEGAEAELAQRAADTQREHMLRLAAAAAMIAASVPGILALFAAFRDRRGWLLLFTSLSFLFAAAAEALSFYAARGLIYTVLFVGVFAAAVLALNLKKA